MGGRGKVGQRHLLELNVSSLSDWLIAYRCITFQYDERANRLKVEGELLPHRGTPPRNDTELLAAWEALTCAESGVASDRLRAEDLAVVKEQKA